VVRERIEIDPQAPPVHVSGRMLNELCAHALEALPEECCGLISGDARVRYHHVHRCRNEMTQRHRLDPMTYPRDGTQAFVMNELDCLRVAEQTRENAEHVTAIYHSHVNFGLYFSDLDQKFVLNSAFPFPGADHIVISVVEQRVRGLGMFEHNPATGTFRGRVLAPEVVA